MYTINERPTVEVELHAGNEIYMKNIETIIAEKYVDRIILRVEEETDEVDQYVEYLISKYKGKEFYLCDFRKKSFGENNIIRCFEFTNHSIPESPIENVGLLHVDLDSDLSDMQKTKFERLLSNEGFICIIYFSCCRAVSGLDYQRWLDILTEISHTSKLYLSNTFISTQSIVKHPCNAYLCAGNSCHSGKSSYPRYLYVTKTGIYPYKCQKECICFCDEISSKVLENFGVYMEKEYFGTNKYFNFINVNKYIYFDYILVRQCEVLEWNLFMRKVINNYNIKETK